MHYQILQKSFNKDSPTFNPAQFQCSVVLFHFFGQLFRYIHSQFKETLLQISIKSIKKYQKFGFESRRKENEQKRALTIQKEIELAEERVFIQMRGWVYDVELDIIKNQKQPAKEKKIIWYLAYLTIIAITLIYIIQFSFGRSSDNIENQNVTFFAFAYSLAGVLILISAIASIYYLKKLQTVQIDVQPGQRSTFRRTSIARANNPQIHQNKLNRQGTGRITQSNRFISKLDINQSQEDIPNGGQNNPNPQQSISQIGSPHANKEGQKSNLSSQNSLQMQQQQQPQNQQQGVRSQQRKTSAVQQSKQKGQQNEQRFRKDSNKHDSSVVQGGLSMIGGFGGVSQIGEDYNGSSQPNNQNRRQFQLKYVFSTQILCSLGWLAVISHISCIYCFFSRSPFWSTTQIWNGVCLFALFPTHTLSVIIFCNANINLLIDRSFYIKCIQQNYFLQIYKNTISQIGYLSMILLFISLIWGCIGQIVKNQLDIPAIVILSLLGAGFIIIVVIRKINSIRNHFERGYSFLVNQIR